MDEGRASFFLGLALSSSPCNSHMYQSPGFPAQPRTYGRLSGMNMANRGSYGGVPNDPGRPTKWVQDPCSSKGKANDPSPVESTFLFLFPFEPSRLVSSPAGTPSRTALPLQPRPHYQRCHIVSPGRDAIPHHTPPRQIAHSPFYLAYRCYAPPREMSTSGEKGEERVLEMPRL